MLRLTRKTEYALLALGHLNGQREEPATKVREISERHQIPFPVLAKVMQNLAQHHYVETLQGAQGGYRLARQAMAGSLGKFLEKMEGPQGLVDCMLSDGCEQDGTCTIKSPLRELDATIRAFFNNLKLRDVLMGMSADPVPTTRIPASRPGR